MSINYEDLEYEDPDSTILDEISEKRKRSHVNVRSLLNRKGKITTKEMDEVFLM